MDTHRRSRSGSRSSVLRSSCLLVVLGLTASACDALPLEFLAQGPTDRPAAAETPAPTPKDICSALFDLGVAVQDLRDTDLVAVGVDGLLDEVDDALIEAQALASAVGEVYRPLVDDFDDSLIGLRDTLDALGDEPTLGASVASVGIAVAEIGVAMDALAVQLDAPCEGSVRWEPEPAP